MAVKAVQLQHADSDSDAEKLAHESDVLMLDTGSSTTEKLNRNDDVQLLNSPTDSLPLPSALPSASPSQKTAPSLADIVLKLEDIKPSNYFSSTPH